MEQNQSTITLTSERVIAYRPEVAKFFDDQPDVAVYFQQLYHWQQFATRPDGYFYKSAQEMYDETCITAKRQRKCREKLEDRGWITSKKQMANGHPTLHFKVLITLTTVVSPLGQKTNGNSQKDKSITKNTSQEKKYTSEITEQIEKIYTYWLKLMVVDPLIRLHGTTDEKRAALLKARSRTRLTDKRKAHIAARIKSMGLENCARAVKGISQSDWHRGQNDNGWKADIEFLFRSDEQVEKWSNQGGGMD